MCNFGSINKYCKEFGKMTTIREKDFFLEDEDEEDITEIYFEEKELNYDIHKF